MTEGGRQALLDWTVTKDGEIIYSGSERAARDVYSKSLQRFPHSGIKLFSPPKAEASASQTAKERLVRARDEVAQAVRERSQDHLLPAIEALVEAKVLSAYLEDGGLIERLRRMRAILEVIDGSISPADRVALERPDGPAGIWVLLSSEAYLDLQAVLQSKSEQ